MATALQNLIDAYIKRNANQEITGPVLNGVLTAIANALGTPFVGSDGYWYTYDADTGQFVKTDTPAQGETGPVGVTSAAASINDQIGTPEVDVNLNGTQLVFTFRNLKGQKGDTGETGATGPQGETGPVGPIGPQGVQGETGDPGITAVVVTVDSGTGTPSVDASISGTTLTLAFHNLKGETGPQGETGPVGPQGNTGVSADYPITIANNLTTYDPTAALAASQGVVLQGEIDQLGQKVNSKLSAVNFDYTEVEHTAESGIVNPDGSPTTSGSWTRYVIPNVGYSRIVATLYTNPGYMAIAFYSSEEWGNSTFMAQDSVIGLNYTQNYDVAVPDGCKMIVICNRSASLPNPSISLQLSDIVSYLNKISQLQSSVTELTKSLTLENADEKVENATIYYPGGGLAQSNLRNVYIFKNYNYSYVEAYLGADSRSFAAIAFYNNDEPSADSLISAIQSNSSEATTYKAAVPDNCKLIAIAAYEASVIPNATIYLSEINSVFDKMDERYNEIKEKIGDETDIVSLNDPLTMPHILQQMKFTGGVGYPPSVKPLVLIHFSDIHGGNIYTRGLVNKTILQRIIQFKSAYDAWIDDILCTGDQCYQDISDRQDYDGSEDWWDAVAGSNKILPVIGNHDTWAAGSEVNGSAGQTNSFNTLFNHISDCNPTQHPEGKCYYYKDYSDQGIRLIVIDPYYSDSAEESWFLSALNSARSGNLSVIIANHTPFNEYTPLKCTFNSLLFHGVFPQDVPTDNYVSMVDSFIEAGGELICWLTGHVHGDVVGYCGTTRKQLMIGVPSAKAPRSAATDAESSNIDIRILGTKSEDVFNLVSFETRFKTVTVKRIGSDYDVALRHRGILCVNYETMEVLYND